MMTHLNRSFYFIIIFTLFFYRCKTIDVNEIQFDNYYFKDGIYVNTWGGLNMRKEIGYYKQMKNIIYLYPLQFPYPETIIVSDIDTSVYYFELSNRYKEDNPIKFDSILVFEDNLPVATYFSNRFTLKNNSIKNLVIKFFPNGLSKIDSIHIIDFHRLGIETLTRNKFTIQFVDFSVMEPYMLKVINKNLLREYTTFKTPKRPPGNYSRNVSCDFCKSFLIIEEPFE